MDFYNTCVRFLEDCFVEIFIFIEKHTEENFEQLKGDMSLGLSKAGATGSTIAVFYQWIKEAEKRQLDFGVEEIPLHDRRMDVIFSKNI